VYPIRFSDDGFQSNPEVAAWMEQQGMREGKELEAYYMQRMLGLARAAGVAPLVDSCSRSVDSLWTTHFLTLSLKWGSY
jgi:hypothetical protein